MSVHKGRNQAGFTLIELLVVIIIIGILLAIAIPSYMSFKDKNARAAARDERKAEQQDRALHARVALALQAAELRLIHLNTGDLLGDQVLGYRGTVTAGNRNCVLELNVDTQANGPKVSYTLRPGAWLLIRSPADVKKIDPNC